MISRRSSAPPPAAPVARTSASEAAVTAGAVGGSRHSPKMADSAANADLRATYEALSNLICQTQRRHRRLSRASIPRPAAGVAVGKPHGLPNETRVDSRRGRCQDLSPVSVRASTPRWRALELPREHRLPPLNGLLRALQRRTATTSRCRQPVSARGERDLIGSHDLARSLDGSRRSRARPAGTAPSASGAAKRAPLRATKRSDQRGRRLGWPGGSTI